MDLLCGQLPRQVHVHVTRYAAGQVPTTYVGLERWIQELWRDKEARLAKFYMDSIQFPVHNQQQALPSTTKTLQVLMATYVAVPKPRMGLEPHMCFENFALYKNRIEVGAALFSLPGAKTGVTGIVFAEHQHTYTVAGILYISRIKISVIHDHIKCSTGTY
jgi:Acyltransferase C-terminus